MPNTTLPTGLNTGSSNHIDNHNILHENMNELSRATGRRNAEALLINGWTIDRSIVAQSGIHIERVRDEVLLHVRGLDGSAATSSRFLAWNNTAIDDGSGLSGNLRPFDRVHKWDLNSNDSGEFWFIDTTINGFEVKTNLGSAVVPFLKKTGGYWRTFSYRTNLPWPNFLPPSI